MRESVWPSMGWDRAYHYLRHRILRRGATPAEIASGLAIGAGVSFTPLLGTHLAQAAFFAWIFRANVVSSMVGTAAGNPWTFPFMFMLSYKVGELIFAIFGAHDLIAMPDIVTMQYLIDHPFRLMLPMVLGGYVCALIAWPVFYVLLYYPVHKMHLAYRHQKMKRQRMKKMGPS